MPQGPAVRSRAGGCSSQRCRQLQTSCTLGITWASCSHLTQWPATLQDLESNQNKARHSTGDKECSPSRCGARAPWQAEGPTGLPGMASGSTGGTRGAGRAPRTGPGAVAPPSSVPGRPPPRLVLLKQSHTLHAPETHFRPWPADAAQRNGSPGRGHEGRLCRQLFPSP